MFHVDGVCMDTSAGGVRALIKMIWFPRGHCLLCTILSLPYSLIDSGESRMNRTREPAQAYCTVHSTKTGPAQPFVHFSVERVAWKYCRVVRIRSGRKSILKCLRQASASYSICKSLTLCCHAENNPASFSILLQ